jgi:hypothetical protein
MPTTHFVNDAGGRPMSTPRVLQYKVGDKTTAGETIEFIYGHSEQVIVSRDSRNRIQWETAADSLTRTESLVHQLFDRLHARATSCLPEGKKRTQLVDELAQALFLGLSEPDEQKALAYFDNVAGRIAQEAQIEARFTYLVAGSISAAAVLAVGLILAWFLSGADARAVILGATAGAIGAWASILSRASALELGPFETPSNLKFQGVTRILLGMIFGVVATVAMKSGELFPSGAGSLWTMALITFASGWSERLVPEVIKKVESRAASGTGSTEGTA